MKTRISVISIIVENLDSVDMLNSVLHDYGDYIIGRMGLPYRKHNIHIISVALDAPESKSAELLKKIGDIDGITVNISVSDKEFEE